MIYDISPPLSPRLAVFPGDPPLTREIIADISAGHPVTLSALHATVHLGAHIDAPCHFGREAPAIDQYQLDLFLGPCQVMRLPVPPATAIGLQHLPEPVQTERLLLATGTFPDWERFHEDFAALSPELVEHLHRQGVKLIGIDTPSVDLFAAKDLPAHRACLRCQLAILEGLLLTDVPPGLYELIALPLKLVGFDASPVRAVLRR